MANQEDLLDSEQIDNLRQLFSDGFDEFIQTYFSDFEKKEIELSLALKDKKIETIARIAHSLKGSSLNIGASTLAKACYALEVASKEGNIQKIMNEYDAIQKIYPKTKEAILHFSH